MSSMLTNSNTHHVNALNRNSSHFVCMTSFSYRFLIHQNDFSTGIFCLRIKKRNEMHAIQKLWSNKRFKCLWLIIVIYKAFDCVVQQFYDKQIDPFARIKIQMKTLAMNFKWQNIFMRIFHWHRWWFNARDHFNLQPFQL